MDLTRNNVDRFTENLFKSFKDRRQEIFGVRKTGDKALRHNFAKALRRSFQKEFNISEKEVNEYVFVEGVNTIPRNYRDVTFFGSPAAPDAAIILKKAKYKIAIELDHGSKGSQIRGALSKASFSVHLAGFNRAFSLFLIDPHPKKTVAYFNKQMKEAVERNITEKYDTDFSTKLFII